MSEPTRYAAPAVRWGPNEYVVYDGIAPEAEYVWHKGALGEHARWMLEMRHKYEWKRWPTWWQLFTGKSWALRPTNMTFHHLRWYDALAAWVLTIYAVREVLRGR